MTEAELISIESAVGRMKAELDIGEKCKQLVAVVRHLKGKGETKPTVEQVLAAQAYLTYMIQSRTMTSVGPEEFAAEKKAIAIIDAFLSH